MSGPRTDDDKCVAEYSYDDGKHALYYLSCELYPDHEGSHVDYYEGEWS